MLFWRTDRLQADSLKKPLAKTEQVELPSGRQAIRHENKIETFGKAAA